jgi:hypothetical protein
MLARPRGIDGDRAVQVVGRAKHDHVYLIHLEHFVMVGQVVWDVMPLSEALRVIACRRRNGEQLCSRASLQGVGVNARDKL